MSDSADNMEEQEEAAEVKLRTRVARVLN